MENSLMMNKIEYYKALRGQKDDMKAALKQLEEELDTLEKEIIDVMEVEGISSLRTSDGYQVVSVTNMYPNIADRAAAYEWLKNIGAYEDMATINTNTFKSFIKNRLEMGEEVPEDCINIYYKNTLSLRRG